MKTEEQIVTEIKALIVLLKDMDRPVLDKHIDAIARAINALNWVETENVSAGE